jgi:hypothetical protein
MNAKTIKLVLLPAVLLMISLSTSYAFRGGDDAGGRGGAGGAGGFGGAGGGFQHNNAFHGNANAGDFNRNNNFNRGNNFNRNNNNFVGGYHGNNWGSAAVAVPVGGYYSSQCQLCNPVIQVDNVYYKTLAVIDSL